MDSAETALRSLASETSGNPTEADLGNLGHLMQNLTQLQGQLNVLQENVDTVTGGGAGSGNQEPDILVLDDTPEGPGQDEVAMVENHPETNNLQAVPQPRSEELSLETAGSEIEHISKRMAEIEASIKTTAESAENADGAALVVSQMEELQQLYDRMEHIQTHLNSDLGAQTKEDAKEDDGEGGGGGRCRRHGPPADAVP